MENTTENSTGYKSPSVTNKPKSNDTPNVSAGTDVMHMERFDSTPEPTIDQVLYVEDSSHEGSSGTGNIGHKRKFSKVVGEGEVTSKEVSKDTVLLPNEHPATQGNEAKASYAHKNEVGSVAQNYDAGHVAIGFDLNNPPPDEGDEASEEDRENEDSLPTQGLQGLDPNKQIEGEKYISDDVAYETAVKPADSMRSEAEPYVIVEVEGKYPPLEKNNIESSQKKDKSKPFVTETGKIEIESLVKEKNIDGGDAKIFKFDLNELPLEKDEDEEKGNGDSKESKEDRDECLDAEQDAIRDGDRDKNEEKEDEEDED